MIEIRPGVNCEQRNGESFATRNLLRTRLVGLPEAVSGESSTWFPKVARLLIAEKRKLAQYPAEIQEYMAPIVDKGLGYLRKEAQNHKGIDKATLTDDYRGLRAETIVMDLSRDMASDFVPELEPVVRNFISMEDLTNELSDRLKTHKILKDGELMTIIDIRNPSTQQWHSAPLPLSDKMWYKGGLARAVLKAYANVDYSNELPWNDLDVVFIGDEVIAREQARIMGVDPDGVESLGECATNLDFTEYCHGRDITMNQVALGVDGLHFSSAAFESAKSGYIELTGEYMPNRAIFGVDKFGFDDAQIVKPRGAMRFVKSVTEQKAKEFDYPEVNKVLGLGVYSLALAKRWYGKPNFGDKMQTVFYLAKRMGLVDADETDIYAMLNDAHARFPFFDIDTKIEDMKDVARWKIGKLIKQIDREFAWTYKMPTFMEIERTEGDNETKIINTDGFTPDSNVSADFVARWPEFVEACRVRNRAFNATNNGNYYKKYFIDIDLQTPPEISDEE